MLLLNAFSPVSLMLIFDCDGVLIDSEVLICRIVAETLTEVGFAITTEQVIHRFAGRPALEQQREIEAEWGQPLPDDYGAKVHARSIAAYRRELQAMPGVSDMLQQIQVPVCVASSSEMDKLRLGLRVTGLASRFEPNILSAGMVARGKPAPDVFLFAAGWMRTCPRECLVVEDSVAGTMAAIQAGIPVIGFAGGSHCPPGHSARLFEAGARDVITDMAALPHRLQQHMQRRHLT
ncbi:MAG: HAD family hydrolase [Janthinobacterium lividum]